MTKDDVIQGLSYTSDYIHRYRIVQFIASGNFAIQESNKNADGDTYWRVVSVYSGLEAARSQRKAYEDAQEARYKFIE